MVSMNILNLPNWEVLNVKENQGDYLITARYTPEPASCPMCKREMARLDRFGTRQRCFMDLPIHTKQVGILVRYQRYRCKECGRTFVQELPDMHDKRKMTRRLLEYIEQETLHRTFVSIADDVGIAEGSVRFIFRKYADRLEETFKANVTPRWMGIGEIKVIERLRCVIANIEKNTIVDLLEDSTRKRVTRYLTSLPDRRQVELAAMDMWEPYRKAVRDALPGAMIVVDKLFVVRAANAALETVRKSVRKGLAPGQHRYLVHDRFILSRRKRELDPYELLTLDGWLDRFPELAAAYKLKEDFFDIWDTAGSSLEARERYREWKAEIPGAVAWAFEDLTTTIQNWRAEIFAYFDHRVTGDYTEALGMINELSHRIGRGYSFEAIRARLLFSGGLRVEQSAADKLALNSGVMISTILQRLGVESAATTTPIRIK